MRTSILAFAAALAASASPALAADITLFDQTNLSQQFVTPANLSFVATSTSTTLDFQGYNLPGTTVLVNLFFATTGTSASTANNLLDLNYTETSASCSPFASEGSLGSYGANDLTFGGGCVGSYDSFTQILNTTVGASYTLSFSYSVIGQGQNGLRIFARDAAIAAVPEPATWAMLLLGFGLIGFQLRRKRAVLARAA